MRPDRSYRLLHHLTLALAGVCLAFAEREFLPEVAVALVPFLGLVALAYLVEGHWVLPTWAANVLGLVIAGATGWWFTLRLREAESWAGHVSVSAALVPYLGPVLMVLLVVKLFQPRGRADFWLTQGVGLLQVALGCILTTGGLFGALLLAYLAGALCCLAAHHRQAERRAARAPGGPAPRPGAWVRFALGWTPAVAGVTLALFLVTPRGQEREWDPFQRFGARKAVRARTGFDEVINLNRTGLVELDDAVAFTVSVTDHHGKPKTDLPTDQRWRGLPLDVYAEGVWHCSHLRLAGLLALAPQEPAEPAGPKDFTITFSVRPRRAGGLFVADPAPVGPRPNQLTVTALEPEQEDGRNLFLDSRGTTLPSVWVTDREYRYRQTVASGPPRKRYPAARVENDLDRPMHQMLLLEQPVAGLEAWTSALVRRLAADPGYRRFQLAPLPAADPSDPIPLLPERQRAAAAQAMCDYLARSGEYGYTLNLVRHDEALDPVMDFLVNVKQGHCNRFSTALALMLRSQGIPARVVKGYRGAEPQHEGTYRVRKSFAHSWVEALVPRPREPGELDWLVLDPTPDISARQDAGAFLLTRWWEAPYRRGADLWQMIVGYNAFEQAGLRQQLLAGRLIAPAALLLGGLAAAVWLLRRRQRRPTAPLSGAGYYARLQQLLARYLGLRAGRAQTPREFAAEARAALTARPGAAAWAGVPGRVAELLYRVRYGGRPLDTAEAREVAAQLEALAAVLR
jgi:transglutaminase-like putative cysteine protease